MTRSNQNTQRQQKKMILRTNIISGANTYKNRFLGKNFLIVYCNKYIEIQFTAENFLHLTGVATRLTAENFYNNAVNSTLTLNNIIINRQNPYSIAFNKTNNLTQLHKILEEPSIILEDITTQTTTFKIALTEYNFTLCFNKYTDAVPYYTVCSHRVENKSMNIINKSKNAYFVDFILEKPTTAQKYDKITYQDQTKQLPQTIHHLIADNLKQLTHNTQIN